MFKIKFFTGTLLLAFLSVSVISNADSASPSIPKPPSAPNLGPNDDVISSFNLWANKLQRFFNKNGKKYTVVASFGALGDADPSSSMYIEAVNMAYRQALVAGYKAIAVKISEDGLLNETTSTIDQRSNRGNAIDGQLKEKCRSEAKVKFEEYQFALQKKANDENSFFSLLSNKLKDEETLAREKSAREVPPVDFVHTCEYEGQKFQQTETQNESISEVLSGGRVWASAISNGQLAIILMRSNETAAVASSLKNQVPPSNVNINALDELSLKIQNDLKLNPEIPQGLVGTRLKKLSNGEWAIYSFGASQTTQSSDDFMSGLGGITDSDQATSNSLSELTRFSELNIDFSKFVSSIRDVKQTKLVEVNVTKDRVKMSTRQDQIVGSIIESSFSTSSELNLVGAEQIYLQKHDVNGVSFYLSAYAWSPSIMAVNLGIGKSQANAAENALTTNSTSDLDDADTSDSNNIIIVDDEDW